MMVDSIERLSDIQILTLEKRINTESVSLQIQKNVYIDKSLQTSKEDGSKEKSQEIRMSYRHSNHKSVIGNNKIKRYINNILLKIEELQIYKRRERKSTTCVEAENQKFHQNNQSTKSSSKDQVGVDRFTIDATILLGDS
jgi:hypothetical protein